MIKFVEFLFLDLSLREFNLPLDCLIGDWSLLLLGYLPWSLTTPISYPMLLYDTVVFMNFRPKTLNIYSSYYQKFALFSLRQGKLQNLPDDLYLFM